MFIVFIEAYISKQAEAPKGNNGLITLFRVECFFEAFLFFFFLQRKKFCLSTLYTYHTHHDDFTKTNKNPNKKGNNT